MAFVSDSHRLNHANKYSPKGSWEHGVTLVKDRKNHHHRSSHTQHFSPLDGERTTSLRWATKQATARRLNGDERAEQSHEGRGAERSGRATAWSRRSSTRPSGSSAAARKRGPTSRRERRSSAGSFVHHGCGNNCYFGMRNMIHVATGAAIGRGRRAGGRGGRRDRRGEATSRHRQGGG